MKLKERKFLLKVKDYKRKYKAEKGEFLIFNFISKDIRIRNTNNREKADVFTYDDLYEMAYNPSNNNLRFFNAEDINTKEIFILTPKVILKEKMFFSSIDSNVSEGLNEINKKFKLFKKNIKGTIIKEEFRRGYYNAEYSDVQYLIYEWSEKVQGDKFISKIK